MSRKSLTTNYFHRKGVFMNIQKTITNLFAFAVLLTFVAPVVAEESSLISKSLEFVKNCGASLYSCATDNVVTNGISSGVTFIGENTKKSFDATYNFSKDAGTKTIDLAYENQNVIYVTTAALAATYIAYKVYVAKTEKKATVQK